MNKLPQLKYIHFALDEKQLNDRKVLLGNGNHWTCFVSSTTLDELYYGDSLGWKLRANLLLVMKPIFSVLMHPLLPSNSQLMCSSHWFQAFPEQNCVNVCGLSSLFMVAVVVIWEFKENCWCCKFLDHHHYVIWKDALTLENILFMCVFACIRSGSIC